MIFMIMRIGKGKGRLRAEDSEFSEEDHGLAEAGQLLRAGRVPQPMQEGADSFAFVLYCFHIRFFSVGHANPARQVVSRLLQATSGAGMHRQIPAYTIHATSESDTDTTWDNDSFGQARRLDPEKLSTAW
jgi:hypothetical protein